MKNLKSAAAKDYARIGLALLIMTVIACGIQFLLGLAIRSMGAYLSEEAISWMTWLATFVPIYFIAMPIAYLIMKKVPAEKGAQNKLGWKNFVVLFLMGMPLMYAGNIIGSLLATALSGGTAENPLEILTSDTNPIKVLVIVILAPLFEEFIFRKQIIDRCGKYGEKPAILFSALSFAMFHMNIYQIFYAFGLGLLFAYVYTRTRKLGYPIAMHMIINFFGSVVAPWVVSKVDLGVFEQMAAGEIEEEAIMQMLPGMILYFVYCFIVLGLSIAGLVLLCVRASKLRFLPAAEEMPKEDCFKTVYCNAGMILCVLVCISMTVVNFLP